MSRTESSQKERGTFPFLLGMLASFVCLAVLIQIAGQIEFGYRSGLGSKESPADRTEQLIRWETNEEDYSTHSDQGDLS